MFTVMAQEYGLSDVFYVDVWPFGQPQMVLAGPDAASQVTVVRSYPKHPIVETALAPIVGPRSIASVNGSEWKSLHRLLAPAFASTHVKSLVAVAVDEGLHFRVKLDRLAEAGELFLIEEAVAKLLFEVTGKVVFDMPLQAQTTGSACLNDMRTLLEAFTRERTYNPARRAKYVLQRWAATRRIDAYVADKIRARYQELTQLDDSGLASSTQSRSILDLLLRDRVSSSRKEGTTGLDAEFMTVAITKYDF